jgi:hypothetical protein
MTIAAEPTQNKIFLRGNTVIRVAALSYGND